MSYREDWAAQSPDCKVILAPKDFSACRGLKYGWENSGFYIRLDMRFVFAHPELFKSRLRPGCSPALCPGWRIHEESMFQTSLAISLQKAVCIRIVPYVVSRAGYLHAIFFPPGTRLDAPMNRSRRKPRKGLHPVTFPKSTWAGTTSFQNPRETQRIASYSPGTPRSPSATLC